VGGGFPFSAPSGTDWIINDDGIDTFDAQMIATGSGHFRLEVTSSAHPLNIFQDDEIAPGHAGGDLSAQFNTGDPYSARVRFINVGGTPVSDWSTPKTGTFA
jgi:hypothetical protein